MLRFRLLAAVGFIVPVSLLLAADYYWTANSPGAILFPLGALLVLLGAHELIVLLRAGGYRIHYAAALGGAALVWFATAPPIYWPLSGAPYPADCPVGRLGWPLLGMVGSVGLALMPALRRFDPAERRWMESVAMTLLPSAYLALPLSFFVALRSVHGNAWGLLALLSLVAIVKCSDAGAYAAGKTLGRRKMSPKLSPNKTIEGAMGALLAAAGASVFLFWVATRQLESEPFTLSLALRAACYGILLAAAGMFGDLSESLIKRDVDCKDSGTIPGLGGVLDVLDSLVFAAPLAYFCWMAGLVGPQ